MMIKALILIHLWSIIVAIGAWALQRDSGQRVGTRFPAPRVWLSLITLSLLPGIISVLPVATPIILPNIEIFEILPIAKDFEPVQGSSSLNYLIIYMVLGFLLMGRTAFLWVRLQLLPLIPTDRADIFITNSDLPPLTLSWPRQAIVIPNKLQNQTALIHHEMTHLRHHDAEITLCLLLLQDIMLRSFGFTYLVRQWRLAIELRADQAATEMLTTSERRDYAALLLSGLRSIGDHTDGRTLPCPTAHLTSTHHRSVKMRLTEIMEKKTKPRKHRWNAALLLTSLGAGMLGLMGTNAIAKDGTLTVKADKVITDEIIYTKRVPPKMPANCSGLDPHSIKIEGKTVNINGKSTYQHTAMVGSVVLKYDVRSDGSTHNLRIVKSSHPCFESEAKASVAQWMIEPQGEDIRDVAVMLKFLLTGETHEDLEPEFNDFLK